MLRQVIYFIFIIFMSNANAHMHMHADFINPIANTDANYYVVEYLYDANDNLDLSAVIQASFKPVSKQHSFGINHDTTWYRITITNRSVVSKHLYLHEKLAYYSQYIDLFEVLVDKQFTKNSYDLLDEDIINKLTGSTLVYPITIPAESIKILYIKKQAISHQLLDVEIYNAKDSTQALINKNFFSNSIIACLFALALYNLMLFCFNKLSEFAYYSLYLFNSSAGLFYMYGAISHNALLYGEKVYWLNITAFLVSLFLVLFVREVFQIHKSSKKINILLNINYLLVSVGVFIAVFIDLSLAIDLLGGIFGFSFITLFYMAAYLYRKKHPLVKIFIIAYLAYMLGMSITLLMLMGYLPYHFMTMHASGIGILVEALLFSYLLNFRIKRLEKEVVDLADMGESLKELASHDDLTHIFNRRAFVEYSKNAFSMATRHQEPLSMLMIDLDYFKKVNDQFGHHTGDTVLVSAAQIVSNIIREEDIFGRIGGEEFCVVLPKSTKNDALFVAEKIRRQVAKHQIIAGDSYIKQTVSIGVSLLIKDDQDYMDIQRRADQALYEAKNTGRNKVLFM